MSEAGDREGQGLPAKTSVERLSDRETLVTRRFDAPARLVFRAWTTADLFRQWWVPKSFGMTLLSCEMDVRVGGTYRLEFGMPQSDQPMAFFGTYREVVPDSRLVWTNDESADGPVTTVTFEERDGATMVAIRDLYPSKQALDDAEGATGGMAETFDQLDQLLPTLSG